jgi:heavy metal sensor kinase
MRISLSIKSRLTLWYLLITALLIVLFSIAAYFLLSQGLYGMTTHPWDIRVAHLGKAEGGSRIITSFSNIGQQEWGAQMGGPVKASRYSKNELIESVSEDGAIVVENVVIDKAALETLDISGDDSIWFYTYVTGDDASVAVVTRSANDVKAVLEAFQQVLFVLIPLALVLAGAFGYFLVKRMLRPVRVITQTAQEIEGKNLGRRLEINSNDELGSLSLTLNRMLERLETAFNREKQFTADASHELRTPLAVVQGETTLALQKERDARDYRKSLETIARASEHMSSITRRLLFLAREASDRPLELEEMNLTAFIAELAADAEALCEPKNIKLQVDATENLPIRGDKITLQELFFNLIDNAIRHTPDGGSISVRLSRNGDKVCIAVKDRGTGIPEEHIKHIFERFYRVDKSRTRSEGGAGLGLAICQHIAELHSGTIEVESKVGEGSTFSTWIPLASRVYKP